MIARLFNALGAPLLRLFQYLGELVLLAADTFRSIFTHKLRWKSFLNQTVATSLVEINRAYYMANMVRWTRHRDIIMGLSKAFCFGILIVFIRCQKGLSAREGAVGVGRATTEAVVNASLAVLICNFFLTMLLNIIYPAGYQ